MFSALASAWKIPELRKKLLFTLAMIALFRLGSHIPVPGLNRELLATMFQSDLFGWVDIISGGAFKNLTVFAMGITPYINASIVVQLLTMVIPYFENLAREGQEGRKKMNQWIRFGAVGLGFIQALIMSIYLRTAMINPNVWNIIVSTVILTAGTAFLMWLGEQITENGIGNGISLIIFAGIVSRLPAGVNTVYQYLVSGETNVIVVVIFLIVMLLMVAGVIAVQEGQRRITVQYSKRVVGRKVYGGQSTHIPMKINQAGVIPIIFAMALLSFPTIIASFFPASGFALWINKILGYQHPVYIILNAALIFVFTYFYTAATFNTADVADNMRKNGGFIPGLRPGKPTAEYLDKVLSRLTFSGATFLTLIALMPTVFMAVSGMNLYFGGTSLLIAVGVALDTMKQIESHLLLRHYEGFMK
ncbi:MAG: preprotein translocase subunit SecY [Bacillota bacterium]|nr:preprotein translocase subunit SecY [Bacillota bacterium]